MITPEAMREKLVEAVLQANYATYFDATEYPFSDIPDATQSLMREGVRNILKAIEAQGLAIVPVKMTPEQFDACAKVAWASPEIYDAFIDKGRI